MLTILVLLQSGFFICAEDNIVFGVNLLTAVQRSRIAADGIELPTIFRECIDFLEEHGTVVCPVTLQSIPCQDVIFETKYVTRVTLFTLGECSVTQLC